MVTVTAPAKYEPLRFVEVGGMPVPVRLTVAVGEALDFWRVLAVEPGERLLLWAEMRLPGQALIGPSRPA